MLIIIHVFLFHGSEILNRFYEVVNICKNRNQLRGSEGACRVCICSCCVLPSYLCQHIHVKFSILFACHLSFHLILHLKMVDLSGGPDGPIEHGFSNSVFIVPGAIIFGLSGN